MALLIDGYNLLHVTDIFGKAGPGSDLHRSRLALLDFLARSISERERAETTIVFDAAGAPPGLPKTLAHEGMTVHFAWRYSSADAMIEELLEEHAAPRSLLVVSSDHRVQRAARHRGATFIDSDQWYEKLKAERTRAAAEHEDTKPAENVSPEESEYWVKQFNMSPRSAKKTRGRANRKPKS